MIHTLRTKCPKVLLYLIPFILLVCFTVPVHAADEPFQADNADAAVLSDSSDGVVVPLGGYVNFPGGDWSENSFTYYFSPRDDETEAAFATGIIDYTTISSEVVVSEASVDGKPNLLFGNVLFKAAGTYNFETHLKSTEETIVYGIQYDYSRYNIDVTIGTDESGNLEVSDIEYTLNGNSVDKIVFTNQANRKITIGNTIEGNYAGIYQTFTFKIGLEGLSSETYVFYYGTNRPNGALDFTKGEDGKYWAALSLSHNESIVLFGVDPAWKFTITQDHFPGYTSSCSYSAGAGQSTEGFPDGVQVGNNSYTVSVVNTADEQRTEPSVCYNAYVQNRGWAGSVRDGAEAGSTGSSLQLQALNAYIEGLDISDLGLSYRTHIQDVGWTDYVTSGTISGTPDSGRRMEAVQIKLIGEQADQYDVYYSLHVQNIGWMDWAKNGEPAGSEGMALRVEAIKIKVVPKGSSAPGSEAVPFASVYGTGSVRYRTHVQNDGWQSYVQDGAVSGTSQRSLRLEGINISLNPGIEGSIEYCTHVQNIGWQNYVSDGVMAGTSGQSLRLEAIKIRLKGEAAEKYDVYYRVHCQNIGWMGWAKNDEQAGSAGYAYRLEAIQIQLVPKGDPAPVNDGDTADAFVTKA